jgi:hypothetical protein
MEAIITEHRRGYETSQAGAFFHGVPSEWGAVAVIYPHHAGFLRPLGSPREKDYQRGSIVHMSG